MKCTTPVYIALAAAAVMTAQAHGQSAPATADTAGARVAVQACEAAASAHQEDAARTQADRAEALIKAWQAAAPRDPQPLVMAARVTSMCRIPFAEMMDKGQLVGESNELLERALTLDPQNWDARFRLAMNHYHTPAFMGRTGDAIRQLETLLAQQGDRTDVPAFAMTYAFLGDLYQRTGRAAEARQLWEKGQRLFPQNPLIASRLSPQPAGGTPSTVPAASQPGAPSSAHPTSPAPPTTGQTAGGQAAHPNTTNQQAGPSGPARAKAPVALDAITVQAGVNRMDDAHSGTALRRIDVLTTPGGTADVLQAFQTAPGTSRANEGSDLYVRGGDPAETPVFINGARLFYAGRYETVDGGVFGILDSNVISTASFASGGFSARWGDALSGVVDVETIGRPATRRVQLNGNTVEAGTIVNLPLGGEGGAWASVRASDARLMLAMHGRSDEFDTAPHSAAAVAGAAWKPDSRREVRVTALTDGA